MRFLFASGRPYLPDRLDGAILSVHNLLEILQSRGHECAAAAGIGNTGFRSRIYRARRLLTGRRVLGWPDYANGYATYRAWEGLIQDLLSERIADFRPDLVLTQLESSDTIASLAVQAQVPVILFVRDAEFRWDRGRAAGSPLVEYVASSRYVAERVAERIGRPVPYVYPLVRLERYVAPSRRPRCITMVNPVKEKGIDIVLEVARRLPHRQFLLVETWPLVGARREWLETGLRGLHNVRFRRPTLDMRQVYRETALLLAPSQWNEAFGRVLLEAQANGIPVVASRIGGIPEALRSGAVLLPSNDDPGRWAEAVERILSEPQLGQRLSAEARENAQREDFDPAALVDRFLEIAQHLVTRPKST